MMSLCVYNAFSATETVDGITWNYQISGSSVIIGMGSNSAIPQATMGDIVIPSSLGGYPVTKINNCAFYYCSGLTSMTIPDSVTSIGSSAFRGCTDLTSITIPSSVTSIGNGAFSGCGKLVEILVETGNANYMSLDGVLFDVNAQTLCVYPPSKSGAYTIPDSVTHISANAFLDCTGLTSVTISSSVTSIGNGAFSGCGKLVEILVETGNANYMSLDGVLFDKDARTLCVYPPSKSGEYMIPEYTIPDSVTSIGNYAFSRCTGLTSVTIPNSVTSIGNSAFSRCTGLTSVTIPNSVTSIGNSAFESCTGLTSVTIPDSVTSIGNYAFRGCTGLTSVTIPDSVTKIGSYAFQGCKGLNQVWLSGAIETVGQVGQYAFASCGEITFFITTAQENDLGLLEELASGNTATFVVMDFKCVESDGWITITGYRGNDSSILIIPDRIDGLPVVAIGDDAFSGHDEVMEVCIPGRILSIGERAFLGCVGLNNVCIPERILEVGRDAFASCGEITFTISTVQEKNVELVENLTSGNTATIITYGFNYTVLNDEATITGYSGDMPSDLVIPSEIGGYPVVAIGDDAFSGYDELMQVEISDGIASIGERAFSNCTELSNVLIPESVETVGIDAFASCGEITFTISTVQEKNVELVENLTSGNSATIIALGFNYTVLNDEATITGHGGYLSGNLTIPSEIGGCPVVAIGREAFSGYDELMQVKISDGIASIGERAFSNCTELSNVLIPESVETVGIDAFASCGEITFTISTVQEKNVELVENLTSGNSATIITYGFNYTVTNGGATITWHGGYLSGNLTIPSEIGGYPVVAIGDDAFEGCTGLTSVTIPEGVTSIGNSAFEDCLGLTSVTIPEGVTSIGKLAFYQCSELFDITIPNSVTSIGESAFCRCRKLTSTTIPDNVTSIGDAAFEGCEGLTSITIPSSVTSIGEKAFVSCSGLTSVTIPEGVTSIGSSAFKDCTGLTSVTIPDGVTSIGNTAFCNCSGLRSVTIPEGVADVGYGVFGGCTRLTKDSFVNGIFIYKENDDGSFTVKKCFFPEGDVVIPTQHNGKSVTSIGEEAFSYCKGLMSVTIPESVTSIGGRAFANCTGLTSVTIPKSVTSIGEEAFFYCTGLTNVTIPEGVASIGNGAFNGCSSLMSVTIPESVTSIGGRAFANCTGLTNVTIPDSVASIDDSAFYGCSNLQTIFIPQSLVGSKSKLQDGNSATIVVREEEKPIISNDPDAKVTGDAATGFVVKPTGEKTSVEVNIPDGVDAGRVTVEVSTSVTTIKPNGATVKIVKSGHNITDYLDIPSADASGIIDLTKAVVKEAIVKEAMNPEKGAKFEVSASEPTLTTAPTKPGLTYTLREGATLDAMKDGASVLGDGNAWTPAITVKGGKSGFYTIRVSQ